MTSTKTRQVKAGTKTPVVDVPRHYLERVNGVELSYYLKFRSSNCEKNIHNHVKIR